MKSSHIYFAVLVTLAGCSSESPPKRTAAAPASTVARPHRTTINHAELKLPADFDELVHQVQEYDDQIRAAIKVGALEKARRALEELDLVLDQAAPLAKKYLPAERLSEADIARRDLQASFTAIRHSIDEKKPPKYSMHAEKIETAIEVLKIAGG